jgi:hypothetical protein
MLHVVLQPKLRAACDLQTNIWQEMFLKHLEGNVPQTLIAAGQVKLLIQTCC